MKPGDVKDVVVETFREWMDDDALQWGAALSYYAALAMAPLLILLLSVAAFAFDEQTAREEMIERIRTWVGSEGAEVATNILERDPASGIWAGVTGFLVVIFGATGVFAQLQKALNQMWEVEPAAGGLRRLLRSRLLAFGLVFGIGLLLVVSLGARAVISGLPAPGFALEALNLGVSVAMFTLVLAAVYYVLPDVDIRWRDVWVGAVTTALLFVVGQLAIGLYLGRSAVGSAYGAAGSLVALLVWIYYSALVLLFGAEFTQVWARRKGRRIRPSAGARRVKKIELPADEDSTAAAETREEIREADTYP